MRATPHPISLAPDLPFKYVGGDSAVDLVNTVDWTGRGPVDDRLTSYTRLTSWAEGAGLLAPRLGAALRGRAADDPGAARRAHRSALALRWTLREAFAAVAHGDPVPDAALSELNDAVSTAMERLQLARVREGSDGVLHWNWAEAGAHLDSILWPVARSAAELLVSEEAVQLRECGAADCGWMYVDRSRNGLRRWCQMEVCGTREKSRRRAERVRSAG